MLGGFYLKNFFKKITGYLCNWQVFTREEVQEGEDVGQTVIKMTNTKLGISTFWTMDKFEDKLIQMREMFQVYTLEKTSQPNTLYSLLCKITLNCKGK